MPPTQRIINTPPMIPPATAPVIAALATFTTGGAANRSLRRVMAPTFWDQVFSLQHGTFQLHSKIFLLKLLGIKFMYHLIYSSARVGVKPMHHSSPLISCLSVTQSPAIHDNLHQASSNISDKFQPLPGLINYKRQVSASTRLINYKWQVSASTRPHQL